MINHNARVEECVKAALKESALGDPFGYAVGAGFGIIPVNEQGEMQLTAYWVISITMKSGLIGYPDIGRTVPIPGSSPADPLIREVIKRLVQNCREEYDKQLSMPVEAA